MQHFSFTAVLSLRLEFWTEWPVSPFQGITESFGAAIHALNTNQLTDGVISRSKRMMLDTLGVGLLGTRTAVFNKALQYSQVQWKCLTGVEVYLLYTICPLNLFLLVSTCDSFFVWPHQNLSCYLKIQNTDHHQSFSHRWQLRLIEFVSQYLCKMFTVLVYLLDFFNKPFYIVIPFCASIYS